MCVFRLRSWCLLHSCLSTECMHFSGLHQQFTSHTGDLTASSWASTSTESHPARLEDYSGGVSALHIHTLARNSSVCNCVWSIQSGQGHICTHVGFVKLGETIHIHSCRLIAKHRSILVCCYFFSSFEWLICHCSFVLSISVGILSILSLLMHQFFFTSARNEKVFAQCWNFVTCMWQLSFHSMFIPLCWHRNDSVGPR